MRGGVIGVGVLLLLLGLAAAGSEFSAAIQERFSGLRTLRAEFVQRKQLKLLNHELKISGEFCLEKGGRLAWRVAEPMRYNCILEEDKLTQWDEDTGRVLELPAGKLPWLSMLFRSLDSWLTADLKVLSRDFEVREEPAARRLLLTPRSGTLAELVRELEFNFDPELTRLERVRIVEVNGDVLLIEFRDLRWNQPIPEEKWRPDAR